MKFFYLVLGGLVTCRLSLLISKEDEMFALARPDVLPVADLAIRSAIRNHLKLEESPKPKHCLALAEPWRPYRSVASWYLWASHKLPKVVEADQNPPNAVEAETETAKPLIPSRKPK